MSLTGRLLLLALLAVTLATVLVAAHDARAHYRPGTHNVRHAINLAFCGRSNSYCDAGAKAWRVAECETGGTFSPRARNGEYLGVWQVSAHWRATVPGFRFNVWAQARHAHRIYHLTGGWSHWACKP